VEAAEADTEAVAVVAVFWPEGSLVFLQQAIQ
jgi:hypothetical protein